ncbi:MAG: glycosyltransferase family 4 protein [Candidatus Azobacteroides sp.]|nr:glycosyltransferase family 4 protein [Candidatus Azobacteroides sp.]
MLIYFKIAGKYNIINEPGIQSSHDYDAIRGGGIVFWLAGTLFSLIYLPQSLYFLIGFTLICGISFRDDISSLSIGVRLIAQFIAVGLILFGLDIHHLFPWWETLVIFIVCVGIINAYNFMDGINGIMGCYSLVILVSLQYINQKILPFTQPDFINYAILASIVFLFFNFRKMAKCFAGDVGSIAISFWIVTLLLQLMIKTESFVWILFLAVYGVDVVLTILHRIYLKQNIFEAHRLHFYQILSNECKISHLKVSGIYAIVQLIICAATIYVYQTQKLDLALLFIISLIPLILIYLLKFRLMKIV